MLPNRDVSLIPLPGRKKSKDRMKVLVCANADGLEKYEIIVIRSFKNSRVFSKKSGSQLRFDYHSNKKGLDYNFPVYGMAPLL